MRNVVKNIQASTADLRTGKDFKLRGQKGTQTKVSFYIRNGELNLRISPQRKQKHWFGWDREDVIKDTNV